MLRRLALGAAVLGVIAPLAAIAIDGSAPGLERAAAADGSRAADASLRGFGSCAALRRYARRHREAAPSPATGGPAAPFPPGGAAPTPPQASTPAPDGGGSEAGGSGSDSTPTNVQEAGIDEPDLVKSDGTHVFAIAAGALRAIEVGGDAPRELGSIDLAELHDEGNYGYGDELLLAGDRLLMIGYASGPLPGAEANDAAYPYAPRTVLHEIDISDPAAMKVVRTLHVEGGYVDARLAGTSARIVVSSVPAYSFAVSPPGGAVGIGAPAAQKRTGKAKLIPSTALQDHASATSESRRLIRCDRVRRPRSFSGLEMLSVLTIDLSQGLRAVDVDSIMTHGETVYGSAGAIYVATEEWLPPDPTERRLSSVTTAIHKFAIDSPIETRYAASGLVPGFMLSQWALSEHDGLLRVASTAEPPGFDFGERESFVTVLGESGGDLTQVGQVGGLGRGERIFAVRFIDEVGFVVTFRQVDPLYTIDLSDPTDPRVVGELKVPGYSAYLHPIGDDQLLGVGQDATEQGRTLGTQVSLFDVADLAAPRSLDRQAMGEGSSSEVEDDHHAFLFYEPAGLVVLPLLDYGESSEDSFAGAVGLRVGPGGIDEISRMSHPDAGGAGESVETLPIRRALVAGDRLYTLTERGLMSHDLATLATQGFLRFER